MADEGYHIQLNKKENNSFLSYAFFSDVDIAVLRYTGWSLLILSIHTSVALLP